MAKRSFYLIAYDISDPRRQAQIRKHLQAYATGAQKSLFECWLTPKEWQELAQTLPELLETGDKLHSVHLPENEDDNAMLFGLAKPLRYDTFIVG